MRSLPSLSVKRGRLLYPPKVMREADGDSSSSHPPSTFENLLRIKIGIYEARRDGRMHAFQLRESRNKVKKGRT